MRILLVGAGGYAGLYVRTLLSCDDPSLRVEGVVDPYFSSCGDKDRILAAGIPVYDTMEDFYREHTADLAVVATPPFLHCEQSLYALSHGSAVLCEKPAAPTVEQVQDMIHGEKQAGRFLAIGYQWSFSEAIQALKRDILDGKLGRPVAFKTMVSWPRDRAYYGRGTGWGGRIRKDGVLILDSIASNACAHYLHNMLFLLGDDMVHAAFPQEVTGDCRRANDIENFDTCVLRVRAKGVPLLFVATHAGEKHMDPVFRYEFDQAVVTFAQGEGSRITATFTDGSVKDYGDPFANDAKKLFDCIDCVRQGTHPICTAETALPHTTLIRMIYETCPVSDFPAERLREDGRRVWVDGLFEELWDVYQKG